jgi:hypothetical protein
MAARAGRRRGAPAAPLRIERGERGSRLFALDSAEPWRGERDNSRDISAAIRHPLEVVVVTVALDHTNAERPL